MKELITRQYNGYNNHIIKACIAGGGKPGANQHKIQKLSRDLTTKINVVVFKNGLWSVLGLDKDGNQTLALTLPAKSAELELYFGDWRAKLSKAQSYETGEMLEIADLV